MTVSKSLSAVWALFAVSLLAAGGITIAFSVIWDMPNLLIHFVIDTGFLKGALRVWTAAQVPRRITPL